MAQSGNELMNLAREAKDTLSKQFVNHPDVSFIGISYDREHPEIMGGFVLRVQLRKELSQTNLDLPESVNDFPVHVKIGDYRLE